jgi:beta-barrel assembly-enhancing protease
MTRRSIALLVALLALGGCATNPVTGKKELNLVSEAQEIQIGQQQYAPSRQSQGGDYVTDPTVTNYVRQVGNRLAAVADRKLPYEFVVINSSDLNAWALPGGKLAINRGLLVELKNEAELAAVLGHEIVHAAARHGAQQMEQGQLLQIGAAVASIGAAAYGGSALGEMVGQGSMLGAQLVSAKFGRDDELEADRYGMKYMKAAGYDLQAAVSLQELFVRKYSEGKEQDWMTGLFASHPPSPERVAANKQTMAAMGGPGGDLGTERYQAGIANLLKNAPAYAKYDQALAAANKGDMATAKRLAGEAAKLQPREARFQSLLGELELQAKNPKGALPYFEKARTLDPGYFKPVALAGIAQYDVGNRAAAEPLLNQAMQLLPNGPSAYYLGRIAEDTGNTAKAVEYYKMVAGSKSKLGQEAQARLARLDLAQNPDNYLTIQPQLDQSGRVWLTVGNRTNVPVRNVSLQVAVVNQAGQVHAGPVRVTTGSNVIPPQQAVRLQTSLGPYNTNDVLNYVKWKVESAQPAQ